MLIVFIIKARVGVQETQASQEPWGKRGKGPAPASAIFDVLHAGRVPLLNAHPSL